jgi:hypothetical protein
MWLFCIRDRRTHSSEVVMTNRSNNHHQTVRDDIVIVLSVVFEFMEAKYLVHTIGLVNKKWYNTMLQPHVWRTRYIEYMDDFEPTVSFIQFIRQCHVTRSRINNTRDINQIMTENSAITELELRYSIDVDDVDFTPMVFSEIDTFTYCVNGIDDLKWIEHMSKLSTLTIELLDDFDPFDQIFSKKFLKKLSLRQYTCNSEQVIEIFKQLPLLEDINLMLDESITSSLWYSVFRIDGVSDRLKSIAIEQNSPDSELDNESYKLVINNLKKLTIFGEFKPHSDLLHYSQHTLNELIIKSNEVELLEPALPCIKNLWLNGVQDTDVAPILFSCHNTIQYLELGSLLEYNNAPLVLHLPKINTITFTEDRLFYENLLQNMQAPKLRSLNITCTLFNVLAENCLSHITSLYINEDFPIDTSTLDKLLKYKSLSTINSSQSTSVNTAENWLMRMLNRCIYLEQVDITSRTSSIVDMTGLNFHQYLSRLVVHHSSIKNNIELLLKNVTMLTHFDCREIPLSEYSSILEAVDKYPIQDIQLSIFENSGSVFNQCHYLSNPNIKSIVLEIVSVDGESEVSITFKQYLLAALCTISECTESNLLINTILNAQIFFDNTISKDMINRETILPILQELIVEVIPFINGINEEKKESLKNTMKSEDKAEIILGSIDEDKF